MTSELFSAYCFALIVVGIPLFGSYKKVAVFDSFIDGAKHGVDLVLKLIPYLVGMVVAIGMLRSSGFFDILTIILSPLLEIINIPSEIIPLAAMRPFSGSACQAILIDIFKSLGGVHPTSLMSSVIMGSTETTFYTLAVYFGAVGIKKMRHAVWCSLIADLTGIVCSIMVTKWLF